MEIVLHPNGNTIPIEMRLCFIRIKSWLLASCFIVRLLFGSKEARRLCAEMDKRAFLFCRNRDVLVGFGMSEERAGLALIDAEYPVNQNIAAVSLAKVLAKEFSHARTRWIGRITESAKNRTHSIAGRIRRAARSARSSVRQTFAARKAAKAADSGGGSSDPDGRRPHTETNTINTSLPVSAFLFGGAK